MKNHDNSKKREARNLAKMQATATDSKILEHTKPNPVSAAQDENVSYEVPDTVYNIPVQVHPIPITYFIKSLSLLQNQELT